MSPEAIYANPSGNIKFALSGGIDRKVRLSVLRTDNTVVSTSTSKLLGATDRITVNGKSYYGAELQLPAPPEGEYQLKAELLTSKGGSVQADLFRFAVDVTPPTLGDFSWGMNYGRGSAPDGKPIFATVDAKHITLDQVNDALSGIGDITYETYWIGGTKDGQLYGTGKVTYYNAEMKAMLGSGSVGSGANLAYPNGVQSQHRLLFNVKDRAGNSSTKQFEFYNNSACGSEEPTLVAIEDPTYSGAYLGLSAFQGFRQTSGSTPINKNPLKAVYRIPRSQYRGLPEGAIFGGLPAGITDRGLAHTDSQYAYVVVEGPAGPDGTFNWTNYGWTNNSTWRCSPLRVPNPQFTSETIPPDWKSISAYVDGVGWVGSSYGAPGTKPKPPRDTKISQIKVSLEPRVYTQTVSMYGSSCEVAPNQSECTMAVNIPFNQTGTASYYHTRPAAQHKNIPGLLSQFSHVWEWDAEDPHIQELVSRDDQNKIVTFTAFEGHTGATWGRVKLAAAGLVAKKNGVDVESFSATSINTSGNDSTVVVSYKGLADGVYDIYGWVNDAYGNRSETKFFTITNDNTPPSIAITIPSGNNVESLDNILIDVTDGMTAKPTVTMVNLKGGPASDDVYLTVRAVSDTRFKLEYPVMFPSLKAGESYTLSIEAKDAQQNTAKASAQFEYKPQQVTLADGMDGKVMIPAVTQEFTHADGSKIIETKPLTLNDGSTVTGSYDVFATLRSDAKVPLVVNGVRIEPGQTMGIMSQHNFGASGGRLSLSVKPAVADVIGTSGLLVMTAAPNSPILVLDVTTWKPTAKLSAESWTVRQVIDPVKIFALPDAGVPCRFTSKEDEARRSDPIRDPVCLLQWDRTPDEAEQSTQETEGLKLAGLVGQAVSLGEQPVEYSLYLFSGDGSKVKVGGGNRNLTVTTAYGSVGYTPGPELAQVNRIIESFDVRMSQNLGPACSMTLSADQAKKDAANKASGSISRTCLFEWQAIPDGLVQDQSTTTPGLSGTLADKKAHPVGWRVSTYSKNGTRVTLNDQTFTIDAIDPPVPTVDLSSKYKFRDNIYMVPMQGDYLGDATITAERADLDVAIMRNTDTLESETFTPGWGANTKVYRRLNTDQRALWEETTYKVKAAYNKVPEVKTEAVYRAVSVPSYNLVPVVEVAGDTAIDTQALPVRVKIQDQYKPNEAFDATAMGTWKVRLIRQMAYNKTEVLTDFANAPNGEASFAVDLSKVDTTSVRIVAEAELVSPFEGYTRTVQSTRPAFLTVLRGGAIGAEVDARRLSGEAPFTAVFKLALNDRQDYRATGDVVWDVSSDGGATWESSTPEERYKYQMVKVFEKGTYKVRAKVINRNSSAAAYTEVVDVIAYDKPKLEVKGPQTLFVGSEGTFSTRLTVKDEEIGADNAVVEWSTDGGKTYDKQGPTLTLSSDKDTRIKLWARVRSGDAPADDEYAYRVAKTAVEFRVVKPPRPYVSGPSVIETGKTYTFKATNSLPYKGMDVQVKGVFVLPNGQRVEGDTAQYTPSAEDLTRERVETSYTAWIEGFREQGAEATHSMYSRVWEYVWPRFGMQVRRTANVAPAAITMTARPIGFSGKLDEAVYEWTLPEGATIEDQKQPAVRVFTMGRAGEYLVKLTVRDARGNETVLEEPVKLGEAEQYVIDLQYSGSNANDREPLDVLLRPYISGGHPRDRILTRQYTVDGKPLESAGFYGRTTLQAGEHQIMLKATSEMGKNVEGKLMLKVAENKLPTCTVRSRETIGSWIVYAGCEDSDGRMKSYQWTVGGEVQAITADRLTISKGKSGVMPPITLVGVDDSGGKSESVSLN
ncbi:hypothetical protein D3C72_599680 [compost metagenome]